MCRIDELKKNNKIKFGSVCGVTNDNRYIYKADLAEYKEFLNDDDNDYLSEEFKDKVTETNDNTSLLLVKFKL